MALKMLDYSPAKQRHEMLRSQQRERSKPSTLTTSKNKTLQATHQSCTRYGASRRATGRTMRGFWLRLSCSLPW